jgi:hypothetical protein
MLDKNFRILFSNIDKIIILIYVIMEGGKRKVNKSLKAWVAFVKKVQREEKLSYKDAIHRAKVRKDKGEKWMKGGDGEMVEEMSVSETTPEQEQMGGRRRRRRSMSGGEGEEMEEDIDIAMDEETPSGEQMGGRRRRTRRRGRSMRRARSMRRRRGSRRR